MGQAYLLILIGIFFTRLNFYVASVGIDFLPDFIGYLLTLIGVFQLSRSHSSSYSIAKILAICFLINEVLKFYCYASLMHHVVLALVISVLLMAGQIAMYLCILHGNYVCTGDPSILRHEKRYAFLAVISVLIYLYLCFFGGYLLIMNLSALLETCYLLFTFFQLYRRNRHA